MAITQFDHFGDFNPLAALMPRLEAMGITTDEQFNQFHAKVRQELAGKPPGTRDSTGMFSVPDPNAPTHLAGKVIGGLALAGTAAGVTGFGGFGGGTSSPVATGSVGAGVEGTAALTGAGVTAPVGTALATGVQEGAIGDLMATGMGGAAANTAVMSGGEVMGGGGGFWDNVLSGITGGSAAKTAGTAVGGGLLQMVMQLHAAGKHEEAAKLAASLSDPFASQRPGYQGLLKDSYTDPNFFTNNPVFKGLTSSALRDTNDMMSAAGYNISGNQMNELTKTGVDTGFKYALPFQAQLAQNAGAGISPGYAGFLAQTGANQATAAKIKAAEAGGTVLAGIPDLLKKTGSELT